MHHVTLEKSMEEGEEGGRDGKKGRKVGTPLHVRPIGLPQGGKRERGRG